MTQKKRPQRHGLSASSIGILLAGAAICLVLSLVFGTGGSLDSGVTYDVYAGPVMPLTCVSEASGLSAARDVHFDFSTYPQVYELGKDPAEAIVTDSYRLTNHTDAPRQLQLAYPFELQTYMPQEYYPAITVEGTSVQGTLYPTLDSDDSFTRVAGFSQYRQWAQAQDRVAQAMEPPAVADIPVKVYHFTDIRCTGEEGKNRAYLTLTFSIPKGANVWVYSHSGLEPGKEPGSYTMLFRDNFDEWDAGWLFVSGGDIENLTFGGNLGTYMTPNSGLEGVTCEYEILETTFADLMWQFANQYDYWESSSWDYTHDFVTPEVLYRDTMKRIGGDMGDGYDPMFGTAVTQAAAQFSSAFMQTRQMYLVFPVTIPAGETVEIQLRFRKEASRDFFSYPESYEIATQLGSNLTFTGLTAGIENTRWICLAPQDMDFDPENGITQTALDPQAEYHRLTIHHIKYLETP